MEKELLIIFVKTVREGEVKTRLADAARGLGESIRTENGISIIAEIKRHSPSIKSYWIGLMKLR